MSNNNILIHTLEIKARYNNNQQINQKSYYVLLKSMQKIKKTEPGQQDAEAAYKR